MQQRLLWLQLGQKTILSIGIFSLLFVVLYTIEWLFPTMTGKLLQWHDPAFIVGIPASIVGVAYVLTIKNPQNYTGFYGGILMACLLGTQFFLQGNYDLLILQIGVFVPFMIKSIMTWKHQPNNLTAKETFIPQYLHGLSKWITFIVIALIIIADYALITLLIQQNAWNDNILLKLSSGLMIASSTAANFWLIYRKVDAWIWWVVYSASGMLLYILIANMFSLLLFTIFLFVNGAAMLAWMRLNRKGTN